MPSKVVLPQPLQRASLFILYSGGALFPLFMKIEIGSFKDLSQTVPRIQIFEATTTIQLYQLPAFQQLKICDTILWD